jgi:thioesterase domain-containing protein
LAGEQRLVAYVVPDTHCTLAATTLRRTLSERLPDYMVPSAFVFMDALPLVGIGKVDRRALPPPDPSSSEPEKLFVAPRNPVEGQLALMWQKLFGIVAIGVYDDFFNLGGHSLIAVQLIARIDQVFHKHLSPATLFRAPTIEQLANILRQETWPDSWSCLTPIQPRGSKLPFFWIHGDESYGFLPRYLGPDQPLYALEHQSQDGKPARYTEVETIAAHYLEEIRTVQLRGPYFLGGYSFGGVVAFEVAQQLKRQSEEVALLFLLDSHFPGDDILDCPPGSRNSLLTRDEIFRHLYNLAALGFQAKLTYVLVRVRGKINSRTVGIRKSLQKVVCKIYLAVGLRLPLSVRNFYILGIYHQARRHYVPQPYPGPMVYIKSKLRSNEHRLKWGRLTTGGMEVHEVPGDHLQVIKESCAHGWAEILKGCLHKAQETQEKDSAFRLS